MAKLVRDQVGDLSHVLVCAGTIAQWLDTTPEQWNNQIDTLVRAVSDVNIRYLTVCPYGGEVSPNNTTSICDAIISGRGGQRTGDKVAVIADAGLMVVVDTCADGKQRIVNAIAQLGGMQLIDEAKLAATIMAPASGEPDLILVLGSPTKIPKSLVWELAYSELVFLDVSWLKCDVEHIQMALDDFQRRDRRFGGIDS